ncbi:hypothetical protein D3X12_29085 [Pseudomonas protegens]|uniref:Uncharacterized protein n=2 Tax=Pseudomonas protegens TaxID=380021 RepID=A0ABY2VIT2_9PSED|nr:hypothetical protein CEP86_15880 [Pseudomonas protegens]QEZ55212.1 hypothetical protein D3X12_29085 [Pseudomonas protegens]QEZ61231.1 hypothetical protein D4N38_22735 [Pseudomonas protegens]QEZ67343.1 hypothetical protein D4N37_24410 [Pseudomonas protegens]QIC32958.1 hypothetical protein FQ342_18750 [Pseudomonas protegens]
MLWKSATALSNKLFREAADLDDTAYQILSEGVTSESTMREFKAAKDKAKIKYEEAMQAWKNANIEIDKTLRHK